MSFKRNDIVNKQRLRDALEEETAMGFAHNDIVTTYAMDKAIAEGGGGGGGETITWLIDNASTTVAFDGDIEDYVAIYNLPDSITADNLISTFSGKSCVTIVDGVKVEAPSVVEEGEPDTVKIKYWDLTYNDFSSIYLNQDNMRVIVYYQASDNGKTVTLSLGIVEE